MKPPHVITSSRWRPPPPTSGHASADVPLFLSLYRDEAVMYRDMSGESLHRRGYRDAAIHRAALNESAAAGVLSLAGYAKCCDNARGPNAVPLPALVDPMCGSGTILIEAALMAGRVAPGLIRADAAARRRSSGTRGDQSAAAYAFERWRVLRTLVPIRPRPRGERHSLRTLLPVACFSPPRVPRFQSRRTHLDAFQLRF
jgi:23S rRNA G2445 N2-methylase RlmL